MLEGRKNIIQFLIFVLILTSYAGHGWALVGIGSYTPFAFSTQDKKDGGSDFFKFAPYLALNEELHITGDHSFIPELGIVFHRSLADDYSKMTYFGLADFGYKINELFRLRYGLGTFITQIWGDGATVILNNGTGYSPFYRPAEAVNSFNSTLNLGVDTIYNNYVLKFETYIFSFFSSTRRSLSYSLSVNYFL